MCGVVIVTRWWLTWLLVSVACVMCLLGANLSPSWLLRQPDETHTQAALTKPPEGSGQTILAPGFHVDQLAPTAAAYQSEEEEEEQPSLGLWIRCTPMKNNLHCGVYATSVPDLPSAQIAALVCIVAATVLTSVSCLAILSSTCVRIVKGANWFSIIGAMQAVAGVLSIVGVAVFPLAWGSDRVKSLCGDKADMYYPKYCTIGWAVYVTLLGSIGLLLSSWISSVAAHSTTTEQVSDEISKGKKLVCLI